MQQRFMPLIGTGFVLVAALGAFLYLNQDPRLTVPASAHRADQPPPSEGVVMPTSNPQADLTVTDNGLSKALVTMVTNRGTIKFRFYTNDAPNTSKRIADLIVSGFYNGLTFHRVIPGFVAQGGDPTGTGAGGSGTRLKAEFNRRQHLEGTVSMARAQDPDSADSQFYICLGPQPHLDRNYTVFGQVVEGLEIVQRLQVGDRMETVTLQ